MVSLCLTFCRMAKLFTRWLHLSTFLPIMGEGSDFSVFLSTFVIIVLIIAILVDVKLYFITVLLCTSLMTKDVEHVFLYFLAICVSYLGNVYSYVFSHF